MIQIECYLIQIVDGDLKTHYRADEDKAEALRYVDRLLAKRDDLNRVRVFHVTSGLEVWDSRKDGKADVPTLEELLADG